MRPMPAVPVRFDAIALRGGLDLHTPQLSVKPGHARDAQNFECSINGGYTRIPGYERFDGRPSPSAANVGTLLVALSGTLAVGNAVNGQTSGATATVAAIEASIVAFSKSTGTFVAGENLRIVTTVVGTITTSGVAITDLSQTARFQLAASALYRADILAVPGSGQIRGGFNFNGVNFALRNNAGGTAVDMYRHSGTGWLQVTLPNEVSFTAGSGTAPAEGVSLAKGAVSAVLRRVVLESGSFAGATAAGRFIIDTPTGGSFTAGALTSGATATLSGAQTPVVLAPSGRYAFSIGNAGNGVRVYGADGVNRGFEFDGTYLVPIKTGNTLDTPLHVVVHKRHLFFSFGASAQHAGVATPYQWTAVSGAAELAINQTVTGFLVLKADNTSAAMAILSGNAVNILYGTGVTTWNLVELPFGGGLGSKAYAAQTLERPFLFGDLGIISIENVVAYGNFVPSMLTTHLRSFVQQRRTSVVASLINYEKSQYRVFFSDGYALYATVVNGNFLGAMPMLFAHTVAVAWSGQSTNGGELSYFGATDGFVYRLDIGTSFDGGDIASLLDLSFASQGNARVKKRYRHASFELQGDAYAEFSVGYSLAYGSEDVLQPDLAVVAAKVSPVYWDSFTWDAFIWDGRAIAPSDMTMQGTAENVALRFEGSSALWPAYTINSVTLHYTPRRALR